MLDTIIVENDVGCTVRPVSLRDDEELFLVSTGIPYSNLTKTATPLEIAEIRIRCQLAV